MHHLLDCNIILEDDIENLCEFSRTILERTGPRPSMEFVLTWLISSRMALLRNSGLRFNEMRFSAEDLFQRSRKLRPLAAYWYQGRAPPQAQLERALSLLTLLKNRQVENRRVVQNVNDMLLLCYDVLHVQMVHRISGPNPEFDNIVPSFRRSCFLILCWL